MADYTLLIILQNIQFGALIVDNWVEIMNNSYYLNY